MFKFITGIAIAFVLTVCVSSDASAQDCCRQPVRSTVKAVASVPSGIVCSWREAKPVRTVASRWSKARPVRSLFGRVRGRVRGCCK